MPEAKLIERVITLKRAIEAVKVEAMAHRLYSIMMQEAILASQGMPADVARRHFRAVIVPVQAPGRNATLHVAEYFIVGSENRCYEDAAASMGIDFLAQPKYRKPSVRRRQQIFERRFNI